MALSMSVSAGKHNARHNTDLEYRASLENVDSSRSSLNVTLADEAIGDAYARLFGAATERYNAAQVEKRHPERCISDYHAKIADAWAADQAKVQAGKKGRGNVPQPCYEYVVQIGSHETWGRELTRDEAVAIYAEALEAVRGKTRGAIDWFQAAIHFDEPDGAPHMHIAGIAYGTGNKRGLETQVSMSQALRSLGLERLPDLQNLLMVELEKVAHEHGIERDVMGCDRKHQDVAAWKQTTRDVADMTERLERRTEQVERAQERLECLQREEERVGREITELEPAAQTLSESARALWEARDDGSREEVLAGEVERLREALRASEGTERELERDVSELERRAERLRGEVERAGERNRELERRFGAVELRVRWAIQRIREVPGTLSDWAKDIARELGKRIYDPNSIEWQMRRATEAAQSYNRDRARGRGTRGRGMGRHM